MPGTRNEVFVSYSHKDKDPWLERLRVHLQPLVNEGRLKFWADTEIKPGEKWLREIEAALDRCAIAVLLVTADFLASDFITRKEIPPLVEKAKEGGAQIFIVAVGYSQLKNTPELSQFQCVNDLDNPLISLDKDEQEKVFMELANAARSSLEEAAKKAAEEPKPEPQGNIEPVDPDSYFTGPGYALVVGIGKYEHGVEPGIPIGDEQFTNLKYAVNDAAEFAAFLNECSFIDYDVRELHNEEATLTAIKTELDEIKKKCAKSSVRNPVVIVYFSGHGLPDGDENYLIPYEARRDKLPGTAMSNDMLKLFLKRIKTSRLVVFLDACHAGAVGLEYVKDGMARQYDPESVVDEGVGSHFIASCEPGQKSYEWEAEEKSIFTAHLLQTLRFAQNTASDEQIDLWDLYRTLRKTVPETCRQEHGKEQRPFSRISGPTGIVLAVNKQGIEDRSRFLDSVVESIKSTRPEASSILCALLANFVDAESRHARYDEVYSIFDEYFGRWLLGEGDLIPECAEVVFLTYERSKTYQHAGKASSAQVQRSAIDQIASPRGRESAGGRRVQLQPTMSAGRDERPRELSQEDRDYILAEMMPPKLEHYSAYWTLVDNLKKPVTKTRFSSLVTSVRRKAQDEELKKLLEVVVTRFVERFDGATDSELASPIGVRTSKTDS